MGAESQNSFEHVSTIESLPRVKEALDKLANEQLLIVHQTHLPSAEKITFQDEYFSHSGLVGTSLIKNPDSILEVAEEMVKPAEDQRYGFVHKGSDCQVIMTFPKKLADDLVAAGEMQKVGLHGIDDYLVDLVEKGEINTWGMPNGFVYGYINGNRLILNPKYNGVSK